MKRAELTLVESCPYCGSPRKEIRKIKKGPATDVWQIFECFTRVSSGGRWHRSKPCKGAAGG